MAVTVIRKTLLALLLLLFCSENVALASVFEARSTSADCYAHITPHQDAHSLISLLAEETEEREERDDALLPLEREVLHPHGFPLMEAGKVAEGCVRPANARTIPYYTLHHKLII